MNLTRTTKYIIVENGILAKYKIVKKNEFFSDICKKRRNFAVQEADLR